MCARRTPKTAVFDFDTNIDWMLVRPRVTELFRKGLDYPLTFVHAPSGYGKTTAALQFAKSLRTPLVYMVLTELDRDSQYFWNHLTGLCATVSPQVGAALAQLGFPASGVQMMRLSSMCRDGMFGTDHVLVLDDFQEADCPDLEQLLVRLANLRLPRLHVFVISRKLPIVSSVDLRVKRLLWEITKEDLRLDREEVFAYCDLHDIRITEADAVRISEVTEGWASAVYLVSLCYRQNAADVADPLLMATFSIDRLIDNTVYRVYDEETREFLLKLSILDRFDIEVCSYLTGSRNSFDLLSRVLSDNSLVKVSEDRSSYQMHGLFREFLLKRLAAHDTLDMAGLHARAGEYFEYRGDSLKALFHYERAGDFGKMAAMLLRTKCASTFANHELTTVIQYMGKVPEGNYRAHPMLLLILAMCCARTSQGKRAFELLNQVDAICKAPSTPDDERRKLQGESSLVKALISFNNTDLMSLHFREASRLLPEGTDLVGPNWSYTFGSPSLLYLYYNRPGGLDAMLETFLDGFPYWARLTDLGCGADFLLRAEAAFERGDYASAEQDAYRAVYRAEEKRQHSIIIAAKLLISKICAATRRYNTAAVTLRDIREHMDYRQALLYLSTLDMCSATFSLLTGDLHGMPKWLLEGKVSASAVNRAGFGVEWLIYVQILLERGEYLKIEHIIPAMLETYALFSNQYGVIRTNLVAAVASYHLYGAAKAARYLSAAFETMDADRLIMPYLEIGEHLTPVLKGVLALLPAAGHPAAGQPRAEHPTAGPPVPGQPTQRQATLEQPTPRQPVPGQPTPGQPTPDALPPNATLSRSRLMTAIEQIKTYQKALGRFRADFRVANPDTSSGTVRLTAREREVLSLIAEGLTSEEIAKQLFVTSINVRMICSKIYRKLGVRSRVEAVRAAIAHGLLKDYTAV